MRQRRRLPFRGGSPPPAPGALYRPRLARFGPARLGNNPAYLTTRERPCGRTRWSKRREPPMYHHVKKLMYTVNVGEPDPRFGNMILEQFGGANGELAAAMQYSI